MTFHQKVLEHLAEAERWQAKVSAYEHKALRQAPAQVRGRMSSSELDPSYVASRLLENFGYRMACATRDFHQSKVTMYALVAMLDRL